MMNRNTKHMIKRYFGSVVAVIILYFVIRFAVSFLPPGYGYVTRKVYNDNSISSVRHYGEYCLCIKTADGRYAWSWYCNRYFFSKYDVGDRVTFFNLFDFNESYF